jgi:hypothetical protein
VDFSTHKVGQANSHDHGPWPSNFNAQFPFKTSLMYDHHDPIRSTLWYSKGGLVESNKNLRNFKMRLLSILLLFFIGEAKADSIIDLESIERMVEVTLLLPSSSKSDISWITDENRTIVFQIILDKIEKSKKENAGRIYESHEDALVRIGHEETTKRLVETLANPFRTRDCLYPATEIIIPFAMWWVYHGSKEDPNQPGWDVIRYPVRVNAVGVVLNNIARSKKFPEATKKWVRSLDLGTPQKINNDAFVGLVTSWWEHNQTAILEKRYADASWLPLYKGRPALMNEAEIAERKMDKQRGKFPWFATGATYAETAKANPWHWLGLGALVCLAVWSIFRWKSPRKQSV